MMEVLQSPSHFSSPSSSPLPCAPPVPSNDVLHPHSLISSAISSSVEEDIALEEEKRDREGDEASLLVLLATLLRKSWVACNNYTDRVEEVPRMEIGCPTNVRHVSHVTFDRFHGFLGLPVEFEPEVPRRPPSASFIWGFLPPVIDDDDVSSIIGFDVTGASSTRETKYNRDNASRTDTEILFSSSCHPYPGLVSASVFGVSTESMQLSFDSRGNSVPTILLLMQNRLYAQGGLQAEGIFRVNAENSQEEDVRDQLNRGVVPDGVDIHCLAGLIKAWFRELPRGVLDSLSPEYVMQCQSEEECGRLVTLLPPTEAALLDWAVNLMADVAQLEHANKMNARNVAMVFAPNMTHMADPLTALMYAVQVMNFLKTLIMKTLRDRNEPIVESDPVVHGEPSDDNGHHSSSHPFLEKTDEASYGNDEKQVFVAEEPAEESPNHPSKIDPILETGPPRVSASVDNFPPQVNGIPKETGSTGLKEGARRTFRRKGYKKYSEKTFVRVTGSVEKSKGSSVVSRINSSRTEGIEAWR